MTIGQALLPEFDVEMANTRKILACVPDKPDYKPHEKSMTLGRLSSHTAELPTWINHTLGTQLFEMDGTFVPYHAKSHDELMANFDRAVVAAREALSTVSDEDIQKTWTMKYKGKQVMSMPRNVVLRSVVMNHLVHHRAQLGVYLRLNDIEIPGMYGPSADEQKFWAAD